MLSRTLILVHFMLVLCISAHSQHFAKKDFDVVNAAVEKAVTKTALMQQLNALLKDYMPSRSGIGEPFNRLLQGNIYHQRIALRFYPNNFFINLLTRNDSIVFSTVFFTGSAFAEGPGFMEADSTVRDIHEKSAVFAAFLEERNRFYHSRKTRNDVAIELSANNMYAMYCGDGAPITESGKRIHALVLKEDPLPEITGMLQNLSCEIQAYGITAIDILVNKGIAIDNLNSKLYRYIHQRNAPVVSCSGCIIGGVKTLYDHKNDR